MLRSLIRILTISCLCLALAAPAAQAYPHGVHRHGPWFAPIGQVAQQPTVNLGVTRPYQPLELRGGVAGGLSGTVIATHPQQPPVVVRQTESSYRDYLDTLAGVAIAALVAGIGMLTLRRTSSPAAA